MDERHERAVAIVGVGAILPDAPTAPAFWQNICAKRYSITEVPAGRWGVGDYYDPDPAAPDKTYSRIGAWVRDFEFDWKRFHVPPRVAASMDQGQQWAVTIAAEALADYGYPARPLDTERTGVIFGSAMGGELHYFTHLRVVFPEYAHALEQVTEFAALPDGVRRAIVDHWHEVFSNRLPAITEDSMPGELANILSGRVANVLNLRGPNFVTDAACASSFAAIDAAAALLIEGRCDAVLTGGVDRNMGVSSFVKFCKIGALSATGTRPFGDGADGFVMGEGSAAFVLRRLADAERDGDRIYAVIRGIGGSSDGKGKGITAPNPIGQRLATGRAWENAGIDPATATLVEAHGTSTKVGDVVEVESLAAVFAGAARGTIALGSAKSNIGHLKAGAGAAGLLKAVFAVHHKLLPPTLNATRPNPGIDFAATPFTVNHDLREWSRIDGAPRRAGVSAYGFGGTNFHVVLEEHRPGELAARKPSIASAAATLSPDRGVSAHAKVPLRGIAMLGASSVDGLREEVARWTRHVKEQGAPPIAPPDPTALSAPERLAIDYGDADELLDRLGKAERALVADTAPAWKALQAQGLFRGSGPRRGALAFLFPGQGSQWVNMGRELAALEPAAARAFEEADAVMTPLVGRPLTSFIFVDTGDAGAVTGAEEALKQTAITQPAVLATDEAIRRVLAEYGIEPDYVTGHSLGEYAALVAAGVLPFADAVEASAARGREMTTLSMDDNGWMAAVMAPPAVVEDVLATIDGYVVAANINSRSQVVIGGATEDVRKAIDVFTARGIEAVQLPVSHAFHTRIVAPASKPLGQLLGRLRIHPPVKKVVANVTGDLYPASVEGVTAMLMEQIASPVQWVKSLETLYDAGVRTFVEVGPKKALKGFVDDVFSDRPDVVSLFTNHPKPGEIITFNQALCGLYAAGWGGPRAGAGVPAVSSGHELPRTKQADPGTLAGVVTGAFTVDALAQKLAQALRAQDGPYTGTHDRNAAPLGSVVISGCGLGLPGSEKSIMDPANAERILKGEQFVDAIPERFRTRMADKHVTRVVKGEDGSGRFETISDAKHVIKLAGRPGLFNLSDEYGVPERLVEALDITTQLAMAAGLDALREAGIPLVQTWRRTTTGKHLPERWLLPESMRDETGVVFASAFPGYDRLTDELQRFHAYEARLATRALLEDLRLHTTDSGTLRELQGRLTEVEEALRREPYAFDRRFLFRVLTMGHSQFAEYIGARGPNAHVNAACASTAQGLALAEDWIRSGRCRRVVVIGADNVTGEHLLGWIGAGFLATGAAATDEKVADAAIPFDRRRHGTLLGMGACGLVVESQDAVEERGMRGIVELLSTEARNSAYHATRLDVAHVAAAMDSLVTAGERRFGIHRQEMAARTVFVSHETFTPARGGSAAAEVAALRHVFGAAANEVVIANTKGFTGHPMGVGIEDVIGVKILEHGIVPPVPNLKEIDPDLGPITLSRGGRYPVAYAIHLAAGFGSQVALTLTRRIPGGLDRVDDVARYRRWMSDVSGYDLAQGEVVKRVLRVVSTGAPARTPAPSTWTWGHGPARRAPAPGVAPGREHAAASHEPQAGGRSDAAASRQPQAASRSDAVAGRQPEAASRPDAASREPQAASLTEPVAASRQPPADPVTTTVMGIVAEKTGYPADMLELDLDLEADLGVDTVKQAETFAAVRAAYGIARQDTLKLRDFPTLRHVVQFVYDHRPDLAPTEPNTAGSRKPLAVSRSDAAASRQPVSADVGRVFRPGVHERDDAAANREPLAVSRSDAASRQPPAVSRSDALSLEFADRVPRRVAAPSLRPGLDLCKTTSVALGPGTRVIVAHDDGGVCEDLETALFARGVTVLSLPASTSIDEVEPLVASWAAEGSIHGVYWLGGLDVEPELAALDLETFRGLVRQRVKRLYVLMRALYEQVNGPGRFLVSATRLGGLHGYGPDGATAPLGGAVSGFTKAYRRERAGVVTKVVDFGPTVAPDMLARTLVAETLADPGVVEVGYRDALRWTIALDERPAADGRPGIALGKESVVVVTGAAGGITSAIVGDLAAASGGTFYLLDLVERPEPTDPEIALFRSDREQLKHSLIEEARARGEKPTPVSIERRVQSVERLDAALRAIQAIEAAGGAAHYRRVDLLDAGAVAAVVDEVRERHGRVDVLLHAAGIEISRQVPDKLPAEFDRVFDIKAEGFFNLLKALQGVPLSATVVFSSVAGRFGNAGQTDYSAANGYLCAMSRHLRAAQPWTRAIAIDWTAWGGIGMATRGSIPAMMEAAGIEMLDPGTGIPTVRRELTAGGTSDEIVVGGRLGILLDEWDATGGLDLDKTRARIAARERPHVMVGEVTGAPTHGALTVETRLDPGQQPFLFDHQIEGTPVLPGVMGSEAFAEIAHLLAPDRVVAAVEQVEFLLPFKFFRKQPATLHLAATGRPGAGGDALVDVTLQSRVQARPDLPVQVRLHFKARVRLSRSRPSAPPARELPVFASGRHVARNAIYRIYFHGPSYQVLEHVQLEGNVALGAMSRDLPPDTASPRAEWLVAPRLVELCWQTAGILEAAKKEVLGLPAAMRALCLYRQPDEANGSPLHAVVWFDEGADEYDARVMDEQGNVYLDVQGYRTIALPGRVVIPEG